MLDFTLDAGRNKLTEIDRKHRPEASVVSCKATSFGVCCCSKNVPFYKRVVYVFTNFRPLCFFLILRFSVFLGFNSAVYRFDTPSVTELR